MPRYIVDTNIFVRAVNPSDPQQSLASGALAALAARGGEPCVTAQVLVEFWAVATRPAAANGLGWDPGAAEAEIRRILGQFPMLDETPDVFDRWLQLVFSHGVVGRQVFDARLVAVMHVHGVALLLTLNGGDFTRYSGISPIDPVSI